MSNPPSPTFENEDPCGLILALDTAGAEGSVAIGSLTGLNGSPGGDGGNEGTAPLDPSHPRPGRQIEILAAAKLRADEEHASLLLPRVRDLLEEVGAGIDDLSGLVVGAGPGSFTGVRVGAATAKGLAWALKIPLWAFSSLAAAAADVDQEPFRPRLVLFDARGDRVYLAGYRIWGDSFETLLAPQATTVGRVMDELVPHGALLMGDGALRHRDLLEGGGYPVLPPPAGRPNARGLLRLLSLIPDVPPLDDVGRWEPDYLRESGAERMWKTRAGREGQ